MRVGVCVREREIVCVILNEYKESVRMHVFVRIRECVSESE